MQQNGDSDSLISHRFQRVPGARFGRDEDADRLSDPQIKELYSMSLAQEEEIQLLRKQVSDAFVNELQLLNEKHVLERRLNELRMDIDEKRDEAISNDLKELAKRKGYVEENIRHANELRIAEEEIYIFTSSLLSLLDEYNVRSAIINASTITSGAKRLHRQMQRKVRSYNVTSDELVHSGKKPVMPNEKIQSSSTLNSQNLHSNTESGMNVHKYNQYPNDVASMTNISGYLPGYEMRNIREVGGTSTPRFLEDNTTEPTDKRSNTDANFNFPTFHMGEASSTSEGDLSPPGIEGFQIIGEANLGCTLRACGYPTNGTSLCIFQWVRHLETGTRQSIEGATVPDYVVTADDVDTLLAVDCIPMDDSGHQGELVRRFANNQNKITCDPDMQHEIDTYTSRGRALFHVFLWIDSSEDWEQVILILKRSSYQIKVSHADTVMMEEKYSPDLYIKVPFGLSTQFVLICSDGTSQPFNTDGTSQPYSTENDIRLRDLIVLTMRIFQTKALDGKRKGKA